MKINRKELLGSLEFVIPGLSSRVEIEQSGHFVFKDGRVMTFNDEVFCSAPCPFNDEVFAVPSKEMLDLLRHLQPDEIDVSMKDGELLMVAGREKAGICCDQKIVLPIEVVEDPTKWIPVPDEFIETMEMARQCCSKDASQWMLTCVHLHPQWIEASDTFQIFRRKMQTGFKDSVLMRAPAAVHLGGIEPKELCATENWVHFRSASDLVMSCRRFFGQFPDMGEYIKPTGQEIKFPEGLEDTVGKTDIFTDDTYNLGVITVELRTGKIRLTGRGQNGWYSKVHDTEYEGEALKFQVAPRLLLEIIHKSMTVHLGDGRLVVKTLKFYYVTSTFSETEK